MNRTVALCILICSAALCVGLTLLAPTVLSDRNLFLKGFVNHEMLALLGVIVTITLASAANLHLELNKLEERARKRIFSETRSRIKKSAYWLISMLLIALVVVVAKPLVISNTSPPAQDSAASFFNSAALLVVLFSVLVLADLTQAAFRLEPNLKQEDVPPRV
jgi:steroid 5-alpha reductase family enzyme